MTTTKPTRPDPIATFDRALAWVARARDGAMWGYRDGEEPLDDAAIDELCYVAGDRGYELFADSAGLRVEHF
jgi:hypothetical protein